MDDWSCNGDFEPGLMIYANTDTFFIASLLMFPNICQYFGWYSPVQEKRLLDCVIIYLNHVMIEFLFKIKLKSLCCKFS